MPFRLVLDPTDEPLFRLRQDEAGTPAPSPLSTATVVAQEIAAGRLTAAVWAPSGGPESGLALWHRSMVRVSKVLTLWLAPDLRSAAAYMALILEVVGTGGPERVVTLPDHAAGLEERDLGAIVRPLGFEHVGRVRLAAAVESFPPAVLPEGVSLRAAGPPDRLSLIDLFERAYGKDADVLFGATLDPATDARDYLDMEIFGKPAWDRAASFVAVEGDRPVGSVLVQRTEAGPLVADLMVDPGRRGRGLGAALLAAVADALRARGETTMSLTLTPRNPSGAGHLYRRLGFVEVTDAGRRPGGLWVRTSFLREGGFRLLPEPGETPCQAGG